VHQAPPVGIVASNAGAWRWAHIVLPALAAGVFTAWAVGLLLLPAAAAAIAVGLLAGRRRPQALELRWDGRAWLADGEPVEVEVMIDLGSWLLLRLRAGGRRTRWLAVPRREAGSAWHSLRTALYAPATHV
jgi:hypothetical protein